MHRNLFALATLLTVLVAGTEARAACTAGNANALVAESTPTGALTDNGDGTVTHSLTGLMWKQCAEGLSGAGCATGAVTTMTWAQALATAKNSTFAGHSDWRLPNKKELESLVERCGYNPAINQTQFPATPSAWSFWSGSTHHQTIANAWGVNFGNGNTTGNDKTNSAHVRLVRSGQSFDYLDAQLNVAYSPTTFTELANDGSIGNGITLTLNGDTYAADVVSANRITASNVPAGLTAHFVRDSATQITATLTGNATANANANDISNLTFTFADGAFANTATAANVIHYARNNLAVDFADTAAIAYSATTFTEVAVNDGSTSTSITLTLSGDTYVADVVSAGRITASNVPTGLTANFVRDSNTQITATLTGNAAAHANANDVANLTFTFADGAFTNITSAATVTNYARNNLVVDFADQPTIAYSATTFTESAANDGSISASVTLTLNGDTYVADVVSANRVTASFVPAGLTVTFVRSSATVIIVLLTGNAAAHANADDIGNLTFAFADGAFANTPAAANVTNYARNNLVVDFDPIAGDTTPDAFAFTTQTGVALSAATTSNTVTVAGINSAAAIAIVGGSYSVNGGAYVTGAGTVSNGDTVTVKQTSSASYSTATTATLTVGGVSGAFVSVTQAASSGSGSGPSAPAPGLETTLTGTTPVSPVPGSTLVVPAGASVSGVPITLTAPLAGTVTVPVTIKVGGSTLSVMPVGAAAIVTLKTVILNGVPTLVLAVSSGTVTVSAAPGQPLLTVSTSGVAVIAGSNGGTAVFDGGAASLSVTSGYVVLPANAFAATSRRAATSRLATVQDGKLYAGEIAKFDADGKVTQVRLGSPAGAGGAVGDPLAAAGFVKAVVPNLHGKVARLSATRMFADILADAIGRDVTAQGQNSDGVQYFAIPGGWVNVLPVGGITVDTSRPDGVTLTVAGNAEVVTSGVVTTLAPAIGDLARFARLDRNAILSVREDGQVHLRLNGVTFVLKPAWTTEPAAGGQAVYSEGQGRFVYRDGAGNRQILFPAFAELPRLAAVLQPLDPGVTVAANGDGTYSANLLGNGYTLTPDFDLTLPPAAQTGKSWWPGAGGKLFIRNGDGSAQGFGVRIW